MTRNRFERELDRVEARLLALGDRVATTTVAATRLYLRRDSLQAGRLFAADRDVNQEQISIENDCLTIIATQQPTAGDLRFLAAVIAIAGELERIGDYAKGIAAITRQLEMTSPLPAAARLAPMAAEATDMLQASLRAFALRDATVARQIYAQDDVVDAYYNEIYHTIVAAIHDQPEIMDKATQLLWAAHNLERTADRVGNMCERIVFMVTGELVEFDRPLHPLSRTTTSSARAP